MIQADDDPSMQQQQHQQAPPILPGQQLAENVAGRLGVENLTLTMDITGRFPYWIGLSAFSFVSMVAVLSRRHLFDGSEKWALIVTIVSFILAFLASLCYVTVRGLFLGQMPERVMVRTTIYIALYRMILGGIHKVIFAAARHSRDWQAGDELMITVMLDKHCTHCPTSTSLVASVLRASINALQGSADHDGRRDQNSFC